MMIAPDGRVLVDARKCPTLQRALEAGARQLRENREQWARVAKMKAAGQVDAANKLAAKLMGVHGPPMPEERKAYLREYTKEHKEEIKQRQEQKHVVRERTLARLKTVRRRR